jgi:hypothetical protein
MNFSVEDALLELEGALLALLLRIVRQMKK